MASCRQFGPNLLCSNHAHKTRDSLGNDGLQIVHPFLPCVFECPRKLLPPRHEQGLFQDDLRLGTSGEPPHPFRGLEGLHLDAGPSAEEAERGRVGSRASLAQRGTLTLRKESRVYSQHHIQVDSIVAVRDIDTCIAD